MTERKQYRAHPITIFYNLKRFLFLAIIPIARGVLAALGGGLSSWTQGLWLDVTLLFLIFIFAVARWWRFTYSFDNHFVFQKEGLLFSFYTRLPWDNVSVVKVIQPALLRPVRACHFRADSVGGSPRDSDVHLVVSYRHCQQLIQAYENFSGNQPEIQQATPDFSSVLRLALLSTNSFVGVFYMATFISQSGKLLGNAFPEMLLGGVENISRTLSKYVPPAAAALALLLLAAWLIGVLMTLLRYYHYQAVRTQHSLLLSGGLLTRQQHTIAIGQINYLSQRQNVLTYLFGLSSLYVSAVGCGKDRNDLSCVLPTTHEEDIDKRMNALFPRFNKVELAHRPNRKGFLRFVRRPLGVIAAILLLMWLGEWIVPFWSRFIRFVGSMFLVPAVAYFVMGLLEYRTSGVGYGDGMFTLRYATGFTMHTQIIPKERIVCVELRRGIWQKYGNNCDVRIYTVSEGKTVHRLRNMNYHAMKTYFMPYLYPHFQELDLENQLLFRLPGKE